jgi:hypothetical protein
MITLAVVLNIFWRRKLIIIGLTCLGLAAGIIYGLVVTPLYMATAQVRPGITSYSERGGPIREWRLKDIVRFFRRGLHTESVRRQMGWAEGEGRPVIKADFIPRGAQNIQGGNVITLQTLSPTPEDAEAVLHSAINSFNEYAEADTVSNGLFLTRRGLQIQIAQLYNDLSQVGTDKKHLEVQIVEKNAELELIKAEQKRIELELSKIKQDNQYRENRIAKSRAEAQAILDRLVEVERTLERLQKSDPGLLSQRDSLVNALGEDGLASWLISNMFRNDAEAISGMIIGSLQVQDRAFRSQTRADSLQHEIELAGFFMEDLKIKKNIELEQQRVELRSEIANLELQRDGDLVTQAAEIEQEILAHQAQLNALTSLEQIGHITTTKSPVRPRRLRAALILACLGLIGSITLALGWEYISVNKDVILGRSSGRV